MAVSTKKATAVSALINVVVTKADYQPEIDKALKNYRQRADIPGFRRGKAPMSMIVKRFGLGAKVEEINRLVGRKLYDYISEQNLRVLGEPMPADPTPVDFETAEEFSFDFEVALAPEVNVKLDKSDKLPYYNIEATDDMVSAHIEQMLAQYGKQQDVDTVEERDLVYGVLTELDGDAPKTDGLVNENAIVMPSYVKDEQAKNELVGAKVDTILVIDPFVAYQNNEVEIASFLSIQKEEVAQYAGKLFSLQITRISRRVSAELDQEFFAAAFGEAGEVKDEATLRAKVREGFLEQFAPESDYKFLLDVRAALIAKAGRVEYADEILLRWLKGQNETASEEQLKADLPKMLEDLTYQIIKDGILAEHKVEVSEQELEAFALVVAKSQFAQYGMSSVPDELLANYAKSMLEKDDTARNIRARVVDNKLASIVKDAVTLEEKTVSPEDFGKLFSEEN